MTALDTLTALADILELHGSKGKPGYELLHSPHPAVALQANIMYNNARSNGKSALEAQEAIKLPHNLVLADKGKRKMGYGDITEAQHLENVKKAQALANELKPAIDKPPAATKLPTAQELSGANAPVAKKPVLSIVDGDKEKAAEADKAFAAKKAEMKAAERKAFDSGYTGADVPEPEKPWKQVGDVKVPKEGIIATWVGERAMVSGNTLSYESTVIKNPDGSGLLVNSDGMINYPYVADALTVHNAKIAAHIKKGYVTTKVSGLTIGSGKAPDKAKAPKVSTPDLPAKTEEEKSAAYKAAHKPVTTPTAIEDAEKASAIAADKANNDALTGIEQEAKANAASIATAKAAVEKANAADKAYKASKNAPPSVPVPQALPEPVGSVSAPAIGKPISTKGWKKVGNQAGSNKGGLFEAPDGQRYYVKASKSVLHAQNEALAASLYHAAGLDIPDVQLAHIDESLLGVDQLGVASKILPGKADLKTAYKTPQGKLDTADAFAVHAWLSNWDAAGLGKDNMITTTKGHLQVVDVGGSLLFRAQGGPKGAAFGDTVGETESLRNPDINYDNAQVFAHLTEADIKASVAKHVATVSPEQIDALVDGIVTGDKVTANKLKATIKARRQDLMTRYGVPEPKDIEAINAPTPFKDVLDKVKAAKAAAPLTAVKDNIPSTPDIPAIAKETLSDEQKRAAALEALANNPIKSMAEATSVEDVMAIMLHESLAKKVGLPIQPDAHGHIEPDAGAPKAAIITSAAEASVKDETELPAALKDRVAKLRAGYGYSPDQTKNWPSRAVKWYPGDKEWKIVDNNGDQQYGAYGASGVLIRSNGRYLLQQRSASINNPLTWSTPGGAMQEGDDPIKSARREASEELGLPEDQPLTHAETITDDRGGWAYHTVILDSPEQFSTSDSGAHGAWEQNDAKWYTPDEIDALVAQGKAHPGFAGVWKKLRKAGTV